MCANAFLQLLTEDELCLAIIKMKKRILLLNKNKLLNMRIILQFLSLKDFEAFLRFFCLRRDRENLQLKSSQVKGENVKGLEMTHCKTWVHRINFFSCIINQIFFSQKYVIKASLLYAIFSMVTEYLGGLLLTEERC